MDPLSALGVAAAVVQFTDFGARLVADSIAVYRSPDGQIPQHLKLGEISQDLAKLTRNIHDKSKTLEHSESGRVLRPTEQILSRLCEKCQDVNHELNNVLRHLQVDKSSTSRIGLIRGSITTALRASRSKPKIADIERSLSEIRQQTMMASLTVLWEDSMSQTNAMSQIIGMIETLRHFDRASGNFDPAMSSLPQTGVTAEERTTADLTLANMIWSSAWSPTVPIANLTDASGQHTSSIEKELEHDKTSTLFIINSLQFDKFSLRESAVLKAYHATCQWIFKEPERDTDWTDFRQWLLSPESQIYWITGKPAAGKSTLMKYVIHQKTTTNILTEWSNPLPVVVASYYFWNAGSILQKSQEGLLRTLLFQILSQMPHITSKVCPRRWTLFKLFGEKAAQVAPQWEMDELVESISNFNKIYVGQECKLALFIDGLDEFDGEYHNLISLVTSFNSLPGIKVCVSSRPENAFADAFRKNPGLRVQDLTRRDMETYVRGHFKPSVAFRELQSAFLNETEELISQIVLKSEGIFLWVSLVVRTLVESLVEGDILAIHDLQEALEKLPQDLSDLYRQIWTRIKPEHVKESSKIFQMVEASLSSMDAVGLWLAESQAPLDFDMTTMTEDRRISITQLTKRRLSSRTRGLLELSSGVTIDCLHRTARDWIRENWNEVCAKAPPYFDPNLVLLKVTTIRTISEFKTVRDGENVKKPGARRAILEQSESALTYASMVKDCETTASLLIKCLDRINWEFDAIGRNSFNTIMSELIKPRHLILYGYHFVPGNPKAMICLAAMFGISAYVRAKVLLNKDVVREKNPDTLSILACAVSGTAVVNCNPSVGHPLRTREARAQRYELVRFLLSNGAVAPPRVYLGKSRFFQKNNGPYKRSWLMRKSRNYGWAIYTRIKSRSARNFKPESFTRLDGKQCADYWYELQKLFEDCREIREWKGPAGILPRAVNYVLKYGRSSNFRTLDVRTHLLLPPILWDGNAYRKRDEFC
ncbi:hypothetical protein QBC43DRAFT_324981 [Cladorrhinum sp. PSN259]|nr:hypothetical protein QBC43DRAFT_324981 [Cladorrhinum sp. PSN259]